jgi:hypothetical protein
MPATLIICAPGSPAANGHKRHCFLWNSDLKVFVYQNKEFTEQEFNAIATEVFKKYSHIRPFARIVKFSEGGAITPVAPVTTITAAHEITLEEALAVVQRLAPEKLRKTNIGRKPALLAQTG